MCIYFLCYDAATLVLTCFLPRINKMLLLLLLLLQQLSHEFPNYVRRWILRDREMFGKSLNCMGTQPSSPCRNKFLAPAFKEYAKADIKVFLSCLTLLDFLINSKFARDCRPLLISSLMLLEELFFLNSSR